MRVLPDSEYLLARLLIGRLRADQIAPSVWPAVVETALDQELAAYLDSVLQLQTAALPEELAAPLRTATYQALARSTVLEQAQRAIERALHAHAISHLWLKGIVLAHSVYPQPHLRSMVDLDLLTAERDCPAALSLLRELGYQRVSRAERLFGDAASDPIDVEHHYELFGGPARLVTVEMHYRLFGPHARPLERSTDTWFWSHTETTASGLVVLQDETHLVYLCAHMASGHGAAERHLKRYLDLHLLIAHRPLNWAAVLEAAEQLGWSFSLLSCLEQTHALFETAIPLDVWAALAEQAARSPDRALAQALADSPAPMRKIHFALAAQPWHQRLGYVFRIVLARHCRAVLHSTDVEERIKKRLHARRLAVQVPVVGFEPTCP